MCPLTRVVAKGNWNNMILSIVDKTFTLSSATYINLAANAYEGEWVRGKCK